MERKRVIKIGLLAITSILALILGSNYLKGIYLFDKDKKILAKHISPEQAEQIILEDIRKKEKAK